VLALSMCGGCGPSTDDYKATVTDGIKAVPHASEMRQIFPTVRIDHFIIEYGVDKRRPVIWDTRLFFGGRYELNYQVYVEVDYSSHRIVKTTGAPKFVLWQVNRVINDSAGNIGSDIDKDVKFGEKEWEKVVAAKGDFSVIGIYINTNSPIPRWDEYVHASQNDLVTVQEKAVLP
jgi:hypothetical protein